jgi:hypothetical protein
MTRHGIPIVGHENPAGIRGNTKNVRIWSAVKAGGSVGLEINRSFKA